jgi:hypothetical protein
MNAVHETRAGQNPERNFQLLQREVDVQYQRRVDHAEMTRRHCHDDDDHHDDDVQESSGSDY